MSELSHRLRALFTFAKLLIEIFDFIVHSGNSDPHRFHYRDVLIKPMLRELIAFENRTQFGRVPVETPMKDFVDAHEALLGSWIFPATNRVHRKLLDELDRRLYRRIRVEQRRRNCECR